MARKRIQIDEEKCVGCGLCAGTCQQSAIEMVNGKAKVVRDDQCDGIGNCLPVCPVGAISFSERDIVPHPAVGGCPGTATRPMAVAPVAPVGADCPSQLGQWPVQIKLVPINAPYYHDAHLLVAADCSAFACGSFHSQFMAGKITIVGCPKLDSVNYGEKLTEILRENTIQSVTAVRMEVPCCGGLQMAVESAVANCGREIPCSVVTLTLDGKVK